MCKVRQWDYVRFVPAAYDKAVEPVEGIVTKIQPKESGLESDILTVKRVDGVEHQITSGHILHVYSDPFDIAKMHALLEQTLEIIDRESIIKEDANVKTLGDLLRLIFQKIYKFLGI